jgi:hypothetical protein
MIEVMRVAIIITIAIALGGSALVSPTSAAHGHRKPGQLTFRVYFPAVSVPRHGGIDFVRVVLTCGHVSAVTHIPDDWYVRTLRPASEFGPEWNDFQSTENAVEFGAGHGVARLRNLKSLNGALKIAVEDKKCFDIVADIGDDEWKTRLRKSQLLLRN